MDVQNPNSRIDVEPSLIRLNFLIQEGYTRRDIENMAGINPHTLRAILRGRTKKITLATHDKIKQLHSSYIIGQTNVLQESDYDEPVIDPEDEKQGVKEITLWLYGITVAFVILLGILIIIIRYILSLFN